MRRLRMASPAIPGRPRATVRLLLWGARHGRHGRHESREILRFGRFIGNGSGTETAAVERRRASARVLSADDTRSHAACADGFAACRLAADYVITEASSGAPLPRLCPEGKKEEARDQGDAPGS